MILWAATRVFNSISNYQQRAAEDSVSKNIAEELLKYPAVAQNFRITKLCQDMQKQVLIEEGVRNEQLEAVSLPVCTCITASLMKTPIFKDIESMAISEPDFYQIVKAHEEVFKISMKECGI